MGERMPHYIHIVELWPDDNGKVFIHYSSYTFVIMFEERKSKIQASL